MNTIRDQRDREIEQQKKYCEKTLARLEEYGTDPKKVHVLLKVAEKFKEYLKKSELFVEDRQNFNARCVKIEATAYKKRISDCLDIGIDMIRANNHIEGWKLVREGDELFKKVMTLAPDYEFKEAVEKLIKIIRETAPPGTSFIAKHQGAYTGRNWNRFHWPILIVESDNWKVEAIDWSQGGIALPVEHAYREGEEIKVTLRSDAIPSFEAEDTAVVVLGKTGILNIKFKKFDNAVLKFMTACRTKQLEIA